MLGMINRQCRHYRAAKPCVFNKREGAECPSCPHVSEFDRRILFVKLDAIGDVLRSASLIPAIRARHPNAFIAWLTKAESVEMVELIEGIDEVISLNEVGLARITTGGWDQVYSLSNDLTSASLATAAAGREPVVGYDLEDGLIRPSNAAAQTWLEMAAFDRLKRANTRSYQRHMCDILGYDGPILPPAMRLPTRLTDAAAQRVSQLLPGPRNRRIAVNVGAGGRWPKKMLDVDQIVRLAKSLRQAGADILLVGGKAESDKLLSVKDAFADDARLQSAITERSIPEFAALLSQVDFLLCGDTLAVHVASAIGLPALAIFGPTSAAEIFDFDGLIAKVHAQGLDCLGCYGDCNKPVNCMSSLEIEDLAGIIARRMGLMDSHLF